LLHFEAKEFLYIFKMKRSNSIRQTLLEKQSLPRRRIIRSSPTPPSIRECSQLCFSDNAIIPSSFERFIGQGESSPITISLEESFLSSAIVVNSSLLISSLTVALKRPTDSFDDVTFELIHVIPENNIVKITPNTVVAKVTIPGEIVTHINSVYTKSIKFPVSLLNEGDLIGIKVEPSTQHAKFSVSVTVS
jgi:hypothetical protein